MTITPHRDHLAHEAHEASRHGLGATRSRKLRAWYAHQATEQDDQGAIDMLAYLASLNTDLAALADMSHGDTLGETEDTTTTDTHSGAPPGGAREVRPHHIATVCASGRSKEAGHVARLRPHSHI